MEMQCLRLQTHRAGRMSAGGRTHKTKTQPDTKSVLTPADILPALCGCRSEHAFHKSARQPCPRFAGAADSLVTVQPAELLRHPAIKNRFAMGWMPTGTMLSHGLRSKCADLTEL